MEVELTRDAHAVLAVVKNATKAWISAAQHATMVFPKQVTDDVSVVFDTTDPVDLIHWAIWRVERKPFTKRRSPKAKAIPCYDFPYEMPQDPRLLAEFVACCRTMVEGYAGEDGAESAGVLFPAAM